MLVDSHCHLDFPAFAEDLDAVLARAQEAGILRMLNICTRPSRFEQARELAERHDPVYFTVGLHPCHVHEEPMPEIDQLEEFAAHPKMVGIGESGLDYFRHRETAPKQKESLERHIEAARRTGLPLVIHARDADEDLGQILTEAHRTAPFRCVMHCFSSGLELARQTLALGFYLSAAGNSTFKNAENIRAALAEAPLDRILVETDAPYLAPEPFRGKRNEPAYVRHTARAAARQRGLDEAAFAQATCDNFFRLFDRVPPPAAGEA